MAGAREKGREEGIRRVEKIGIQKGQAKLIKSLLA